MERPVPLTYNRAATAVVRSRIYLERAREEAQLALEILAQMDGTVPLQPTDPPERLLLMRKLERYLDGLSAMQAAVPEARGLR